MEDKGVKILLPATLVSVTSPTRAYEALAQGLSIPLSTIPFPEGIGVDVTERLVQQAITDDTTRTRCYALLAMEPPLPTTALQIIVDHLITSKDLHVLWNALTKLCRPVVQTEKEANTALRLKIVHEMVALNTNAARAQRKRNGTQKSWWREVPELSQAEVEILWNAVEEMWPEPAFDWLVDDHTRTVYSLPQLLNQQQRDELLSCILVPGRRFRAPRPTQLLIHYTKQEGFNELLQRAFTPEERGKLKERINPD